MRARLQLIWNALRYLIKPWRVNHRSEPLPVYMPATRRGRWNLLVLRIIKGAPRV